MKYSFGNVKNKFQSIRAGAFLITCAVFALPVYGAGLQSVSNKPAEVEADQLEYLEKESKILASGDVRITQEGRLLEAQKVSYDQNNALISAEGKIHFQDLNGNNYYADSVEMNDQLNKGKIHNLNGKLSDNALISADEGIRESDKVTILHNAAYTPCKVCAKKHGGEPLWKITADEVKIDEDAQRVTYDNAALNFFGVPVLYTPYLSHATPDADRKSGFMVPSYSNVSTLGFTLKTPYYINIAEDKDAMFEPIFTTEEGIILSGSYRHLLSSGSYELQGSITNPDKRDTFGNPIQGHEIRGHIQGQGHFAINDKWSWGFDGKQASDDTYLRRYKFGNEDHLVSKAYVNYFDDRDYIGTETVYFQGLRANDDPETTPLVLPISNAHFESDPMMWGSRVTYDANVLALSRDRGIESRRITNNVGWNVPYTTDNGHVFEARTSVRGDIYHVDDVVDGSLLKDGYTGRMIPEAEIDWSYPLAGKSGNTDVYIEPVANFIISPNGGNPNKIPNEDSNVIELSDTNLFSNNHFTGLDRVEGGARTNYGVRGRVNNDMGEVSFLAGQSYRATSDESFTEESGLNDNFSDYVGRVSVDNNNGARVNYRFRVDKDDLVLRRSEVNGTLSFDRFSISSTYVNIDELNNSFDRNEIAAAARVNLDNNWHMIVDGRRDLAEGQRNGQDVGGWRSTGFGIGYEDECIIVKTTMRRDFVRDRDIEPSTTFMLQVALKNLGNI